MAYCSFLLYRYNTLIEKFNEIVKSRTDSIEKIQKLDQCLDLILEMIKKHPKYSSSLSRALSNRSTANVVENAMLKKIMPNVETHF